MINILQRQNRKTKKKLRTVIGFGVIVVPVAASAAGALSLGKILYKKIIKKYNKYENQNDKDQQTINSSEKL